MDDCPYMKSLDVTTEAIALSFQLLGDVVLVFDHAVERCHLCLDSINCFAKGSVLCRQKLHLPKPNVGQTAHAVT